MNITLPGAFSGKVTLDVGFTDDLVVFSVMFQW